MLIILIALILGVIEGITEFLPISSTGHLIVAERLLGYHDAQDLFTVVIQLGAIAAVVWFYRQDLWNKTAGLFRRDADALNFWKLLVIATIPAGIVGLLLNSSMDAITTPLVVAIMLIIGAVILWFVDRKPVHKTDDSVDFKQLTIKRALLIGVGQSIAIVPGVSRSGATIVSGLAAGLNRPTATAFSFYMSIPVMVLASGLKIVKDPSAITQLPGGAPALIVGVIAAFITALLAVTWLLRYIAHNNFKLFAYYRAAAGVIILILLGLNII